MGIRDLLQKGGRAAMAEALGQLDRNAAVHNDLDKWVLSDLKAEAPAFREAMDTPLRYEKEGRTVEYEPSADIRDDLFYLAHSPGESRVKPAGQVRPSHYFGRDVEEKFVQTEAHQEMKPYLESDALASAIYARASAQKFEELMREQQEELEESQKMKDLEDMLEGEGVPGSIPGNGPGAPGSGQGQDPNGQRQYTDEQLDAAAEKLAQMEAEAAARGLSPEIQQGIEQAANDGKEKAEAWGRLAGLDSQLPEYTTPEEALALTESFLAIPEFQELSHLIGRVSQDFRAMEARQVIGGDEDVTGVTTGNDLPNVLTTELQQLGHPLLTRKFMKDFIDESLLQHETQGQERVSNGPGVFCVDTSGSMNGSDLLQAKAVVIAFIRLMHKSRRDAVVICFQSSVVATFEFPRRGPLNMRDLALLAGIRAGGGTSITRAVQRAEDIINQKATFKKGDLVIVTDGGDYFNDEVDGKISNRLREKGIRSHGIAIGQELTEGHYLTQFCDDAVGATDILQAAGNIAAVVR